MPARYVPETIPISHVSVMKYGAYSEDYVQFLRVILHFPTLLYILFHLYRGAYIRMDVRRGKYFGQNFVLISSPHVLLFYSSFLSAKQ